MPFGMLDFRPVEQVLLGYVLRFAGCFEYLAVHYSSDFRGTPLMVGDGGRVASARAKV